MAHYDEKKMTEAMKGALKNSDTMFVVKKEKPPKDEPMVSKVETPHLGSLSVKQLPYLDQKNIGDKCAFEVGVRVNGIRENENETEKDKSYDFDVEYIKVLTTAKPKNDEEKKPKNMEEAYEKTNKEKGETYVKTQESHYVG